MQGSMTIKCKKLSHKFLKLSVLTANIQYQVYKTASISTVIDL